MGEELASDVALEAADGFGLGFAFVAAASEVRAGVGVVGEAGDDDAPQGAVGLAVAGPAEAMSLLLAAGCVQGCGATQTRESPLVAEAVRVLARGDEECAGGLGADTELFHELRSGVRDEWFENVVEGANFVIEFQHAAGGGLGGEAGRVGAVGAAPAAGRASRGSGSRRSWWRSSSGAVVISDRI